MEDYDMLNKLIIYNVEEKTLFGFLSQAVGWLGSTWYYSQAVIWCLSSPKRGFAFFYQVLINHTKQAGYINIWHVNKASSYFISY